MHKKSMQIFIDVMLADTTEGSIQLVKVNHKKT